MAPTTYEIVFWIISLIVLVGFLLWGVARYGRDENASEYWIDRNVRGRK